MSNKIFITLTQEEVTKHKSLHSCWVIHKDKVYDVTPFLHDHPGGEEILLKYSGNDITKTFQEIGHSDHAHVLLDQYFIGNLGDEIEMSEAVTMGNSINLFNKIRTRLFTREDKFGLHKLFGLISLIGLIGAAIAALLPQGTFPPFFAKPGLANIFLLVCNSGVALSALMFHVPLKKDFQHIEALENREQRLHSMIFSMRSISFVLWYMFEPLLIFMFPVILSFLWLLRFLLLSLWHSLADLVTFKYAGLNSSTIRGANSGKTELEKLAVSLASIAQIGAILILLGFSGTNALNRSYLADLCYITLLPIQLVVFQFTLKRKGFLSAKMNSWLYMLELSLVLIAVAPDGRELFLLVLFAIARFIFQLNKYLLFLLFAFLAQFFTFSIHPVVPLVLGLLLILKMQQQSQVQAFRAPTSIECKILEKSKPLDNIYHLLLETPKGFSYKMPRGKHLALVINEELQRFYTPITASADGRYFEILAKTYSGGKANNYLESVAPGDLLTFSGPFGDIFYAENKVLRYQNRAIKLKHKKIICIAGGSGITPIYSMLSVLCKSIDVELFYINRTKKDILLYNQIQNLSKNVKVHYYLTQEQKQEEWFTTGYFKPKSLFADVFLISGPPEFCKTYKQQLTSFSRVNNIVVF